MKDLLFCLLAYCCGTPFFASGQPIRAIPLSDAGSIRVVNDSLQKNYNDITLEWRLLVNGLQRQKGAIPALSLFPGRPRTLHLPLRPASPGEEASILLTWRGMAPSRPILATQVLPWKSWGADIRIPVTGDLSFADSSEVFTITSPTLHLSFDKESGWIRRYSVNDQLLIADSNGLRPTLPATPHLQLFSTSTGSQMVIVRTEYSLPDQSWLLHLSYTVNSTGALLIEETLERDTTRPDSLAHLIGEAGMTLSLPAGVDSASWYGLAKIADSTPAIYKVPLGAGNSGDGAAFIAPSVRWCAIRDREGKGFQLTADSNLLRSVSADPLSKSLYLAAHQNTLAPFPIHHLAFRLTPLNTVMLHPATPSKTSRH